MQLREAWTACGTRRFKELNAHNAPTIFIGSGYRERGATERIGPFGNGR